MMDDDWGVRLAVAAILFLLLFFAWAISSAVVDARTERACMERGWPGHNVTWNFDRYCIKRVQQTDTVAPLSRINKAGAR